MAIEKVELMHECFPKHLSMATARMKENKEISEGKKKREKMERSGYEIKKP